MIKNAVEWGGADRCRVVVDNMKITAIDNGKGFIWSRELMMNSKGKLG